MTPMTMPADLGNGGGGALENILKQYCTLQSATLMMGKEERPSLLAVAATNNNNDDNAVRWDFFWKILPTKVKSR